MKKLVVLKVRFILTGTPVENRLLDLWSLFDFVAPGLLGSSKSFSNYGKKTIQHQFFKFRQCRWQIMCTD